MTAVFDASAFLALVLGERGGARVAEYVGGALMPSVNYVEVLTKLGDGCLPGEAAETIVERLRIQIGPFRETHAVRAARLRRPRPVARRSGLHGSGERWRSEGDRH